MKVISSKIPRLIIYFLIILLIITVIYLIYPKYQIISSSGDIYKINKITGQVTRKTYPSKAPKGFGDVSPYSTKKSIDIEDFLKEP